jgi:signal transduction histidine kinase
VAVILLVVGVVVVLLQRGALTANIDNTLTQRADDIDALISEGELPAHFSPSGVEGFVQLVSETGQVAASTPNLNGMPPLDLTPPTETDTIENAMVIEVDDDVFRVLSRRVESATLYVGTTYDVVGESTVALVASLALTIPAGIAILGMLVWWLVGRTLQPVDNIRAEVATIGSTDLQRRVPRPGTNDEIDQLAVTMNQMLDRLQSSVEQQLRFVADASHELRSPLTRLRAQLELEMRSGQDLQAEGRLRAQLDEVIGLQNLVEDLLYLARADARSMQPTRVPVDLDDLVFDEGRAVAANGRVRVNFAGVSGAHVTGDPGQMSRAVKNLLQNAERHAASQVVLALREIDGSAVLTVQDDGPGIPVSGAERIFERFGRLDEARTPEAGGSGLGLAIAKEIAERHGGTLLLVNPGEPGAILEMRLPVADSG